MTAHQPLAVQPATGDPSLVTTAQEFRQFIWTMLGAANSYPGAEGVMDVGIPSAGAMTGDFSVTQRGAGANGSVDVSAGHALTNGDDISSQGTYALWNDGVINVAVPLSPPAQRIHRLVLQVQDKLSLGTWSGYTFAPVLLQDVGSGTPAQPNSAITLALITVNPADPSVQNAAIADYRRAVGPVAASTATAETKSNTTLADSASLQLWGLRDSAWYGFAGFLNYDGANQNSSGDPGGIHVTWRTPGPSNVKLFHTAIRNDSNNNASVGGAVKETDTWNGWTDGAGVSMSALLVGAIQTTSTKPNNFAVLQFCQNNSSGTNTRILAGSMVYAWPIS
jgi:hypothetical protein